jgi:hypothetical protein
LAVGVLAAGVLLVGCAATTTVDTGSPSGSVPPATAPCPAAPTTTAPPPVTPEMSPEFASAVRGRADFGLNDDPTFVAAVLKRPDVNGTFGVPITPDEVPLVRHQLQMQQELHHFDDPVPRDGSTGPAAGLLAVAVGGSYAGAWVSHVGAGSIVVASSQPVDETAIRALFPADATVEVDRVPYSYRQLAAAASTLTQQIADDRLAPATTDADQRVMVDDVRNGLTLQIVGRPDTTLECTLRRLAGPIPLTIEYQTHPGQAL